MTSGQLSSALDFIREQRSQFLEYLKAFVRISSISTDPSAKPEMAHAADWVAWSLRRLGFQNVEIPPRLGIREDVGHSGRRTSS